MDFYFDTLDPLNFSIGRAPFRWAAPGAALRNVGTDTSLTENNLNLNESWCHIWRKRWAAKVKGKSCASQQTLRAPRMRALCASVCFIGSSCAKLQTIRDGGVGRRRFCKLLVAVKKLVEWSSRRRNAVKREYYCVMDVFLLCIMMTIETKQAIKG